MKLWLRERKMEIFQNVTTADLESRDIKISDRSHGWRRGQCGRQGPECGRQGPVWVIGPGLATGPVVGDRARIGVQGPVVG